MNEEILGTTGTLLTTYTHKEVEDNFGSAYFKLFYTNDKGVYEQYPANTLTEVMTAVLLLQGTTWQISCINSVTGNAGTLTHKLTLMSENEGEWFAEVSSVASTSKREIKNKPSLFNLF